ncbi:TPM domain-containing protein [bacterium]|nr:TPM domain-containing protein [bacterium]
MIAQSVIDTVGVISPQEKALMESVSDQLYRAVTIQLETRVVLTTGDQSISDLAKRSLDTSKGVLLLVAVEDGQSHIQIGTGLATVVPDEEATGVLDQYIRRPMRFSEQGTGIVAAHMDLAQRLAAVHDINLQVGDDSGFESVRLVNCAGAGLILLMALGLGVLIRRNTL